MAMKKLPVPPEADGDRVDSFLRRYLPELPGKAVQAAFNRRDVKLDGKRVPKDARVSAGQELQIFYSDIPDVDPLSVVYEDDDVLLVNKAAGISVEPDSGGGVSLTELCLRHVRLLNPESQPPAACHRLDNQTSGLCLFAKNDNALNILQDVFRSRSMEKYYECLVRGTPKPPAAICQAYLLKDAKRARVTVLDHQAPGARLIITGYETLRSGQVSRLRVDLVTGRTHQIRAHLAALGHPILGDDVYGDRAFNRAQKVRTLCLCAVSLRLDTSGRLPSLDNRLFRISPPF